MGEFSDVLEAAKHGDPEALARLYERYGGPVIGVIRKRLSQPLRRRFDTMDLAHSVFTEVIRDLPRFRDLGEGAFQGWLRIKAESKVVSKLRKHLGRHGQRAERPLDANGPLAAAGASPASNAARVEEEGRARDLVATLDEEQRTLVLMRIEEELSFAAIAEKLGLPSAEAARKRYARCLAKLRERWP